MYHSAERKFFGAQAFLQIGLNLRVVLTSTKKMEKPNDLHFPVCAMEINIFYNKNFVSFEGHPSLKWYLHGLFTMS